MLSPKWLTGYDRIPKKRLLTIEGNQKTLLRDCFEPSRIAPMFWILEATPGLNRWKLLVHLARLTRSKRRHNLINLRNREISWFDTICPMHHTAHVFSIVFLRIYIYNYKYIYIYIYLSILHDLAWSCMFIHFSKSIPPKWKGLGTPLGPTDLSTSTSPSVSCIAALI